MKYTSVVSLLSLAFIAEAQYSGCNTGSYYSGFNPSSYSRSNKDALRTVLGDLLFSTHRGVVPNTNTEDPGVDDTWAALTDLDQGSTPNKVKLIYSQDEVASVPFGGSRGWVKEHLHPILRGVGLLGPDVSDVHNLRPVNYISNIVRGTKYYGECGVLVPLDTCETPAEGGGNGTCSCNRVYTPPPEVRGDIARALMYMDVRYDGRDDNTINLRLTDCPFQHERDMAYLSQMLTWHKEDPVDEAETIRNNKVCEKYQGNRNPFVDFPELAEKLWEEALPLPATGDRQIYEACEKIPTEPPTFAPNQCERLDEGDIYLWLLNSKDPDTLGLFTFQDLEEDLELFITTNPWDGSGFLESGGTVKMTVPSGGLNGGTAFGFGSDLINVLPGADLWQAEQGAFSLPEDGEIVFVYCLDNFDKPRPIVGLTYGNAQFVPAADSYGVAESTLPDTLGETGLIKLQAGFANAVFDKDHNGYSDDALKAIVRDSSNWKMSNTDRFGPPGSSAFSAKITFSIAATTATLAATWFL